MRTATIIPVWASDDCGYYYMADENHGAAMKVIDVSNPCDIEEVNTFDANVSAPTSIPHNQIAACNYLYVAYYYDGLRVYDISDPVNPEQVLYYDTSSEPDDDSYKGAWGIYPLLPSGNILISDMQNGLYVFEGIGDNCAATQTIEDCNIDCNTATSTLDFNKGITFDVSPTPTTGTLNVNINLTESQSRVKLELVDISGRVVQRFSEGQLWAGTHALPLEVKNDLKNGFYFLKISTESQQITKKVVLTR